MKKIKLLLAAMAAMVTVGVNAQSVAAPCSDIVSGQEYYVMNVGVGQFLTGANSWGTQISMTTTGTGLRVRLEQGTFTVGGQSVTGWKIINVTNSNKLFFRDSEGAGFVDKGSQDKGFVWNITKVNGAYHIQTAVGDPTYPAAAIQYANATTAGGAVVFDNGPMASNIDWMFFSAEQAAAENVVARARLYAALVRAYNEGMDVTDASAIYENENATAEQMESAVTTLNSGRYANALAKASNSDPRDITEFVLSNADFSNGNTDGWETNYVKGEQANNIGYQGAKYVNGNVAISKFIEAWRNGATLGDGYLRQTVADLPEGKYLLECDAISVWQANQNLDVTGAQLYAVADGVEYTKDLNTLNEKPQHFEKEFLFSGEGDIIFGLRTKNATCNWLCADNFKVTFYGIDLSAYVTQLENAVAEFNALSGNCNAALYAAQKDIVDEKNATYTSSKAYAAAIAAVQNATALVQASIDSYAEAKTYLDKASGLDAAGQTSYNANETVAAVKAAYDASTFEALTEEQKTAMDAAVIIAAKAQNTAGSDWTLVLVNPSFENGFSSGWTNNGMAIQNNGSFAKDGNNYCEKWQPDGTFSVSQTVSAMPIGVYRVTVKAKTRGVTSGKVFAGGVEVSTKIADEVNTYTVEFACDDNADITIGFEGVGTGAESSWLALDDFHMSLVSAGLPDVTAVEGKMNSEVAASQATAIETYNANKTVANYNAVSAAITAAQASVDAYVAALSAISKANAVKNAHNFASTAAVTTFADAIADVQTAYDNSSLTNDEANAAATTLGVAVTGWHGGNNSAAVVYLRDGFALGDFEADPALHVNTWSTEGDNDGSGFSVPFYESWTSDANSLPESVLTGTLTDLPNGQYKVSAWVRVRANNATEATAATGITMDVNGGEAVDVTEGEQVGTSKFNIDTYEAYGLVKQGTLTLNFNIAADANISWLSFKNVKYTKVRDLTPEEAFVPATDEDYALLNGNLDKYILGFEAGEFAPYNNPGLVQAIAAAKAIDQEASNSQESVQAAAEAITSAGAVANETEVNAIYNGDFAIAAHDGASNPQPIGWYRNEGSYTGDGTNVRYVSIPSGVEGNTSAKGLFGKFTMKYGAETGYSLPLKQGFYKLTFSYGGWNEKGARDVQLYNEENTATVEISTVTAANNTAHTTASSWRAYSSLITVPAAGDYTLSFYRQNTTSQNQIVLTDIVLVKATAADFKVALAAEIETASALYNNGANVGAGAFQIPAADGTAMSDAVSAAQTVYDNTDATIEEVIAATESVTAAVEAYKNVELNAPATGKVYNIINVSDGYDHNGKAVTCKAASDADLSKNTTSFGYNETPGSIFPQGFTFTAVDGQKNVYKLSYTRADGQVVYVGTGSSTGLGSNNDQIRPTTDASKAVAIRVDATSTENVWNLYNTLASKNIGANGKSDQGFYTVNSYNKMKIQEAEENEVALTIKAENQYGTLIIPFASEVPSGVIVYSIESISGEELNLDEVDAIAANTPYVVYAASGIDETLSGMGSAYTDATYTDANKLLTGAYSQITAPVGRYVLQNGDEGIGFYRVAEGTINVPANRAYLTTTAGVKAFILNGGDTDAIKSVFSGIAAGKIYDLSGRKVAKMQKGNTYIVNGKKVNVK